MANLFHSLSSFIGGRADAAAPPNEAQASTVQTSAPAQTTPTGPDLARDGVLAPPQVSHADDVGDALARELPLVAYATPHEEISAPRPRRSRAVSLLRSASATAVTSRTVPTLPSVATRHAAHTAGPLLTETERIRLQVMQTQLQLSVLRLYDGPIDGIMSPALARAVRYFQTLKGIRATGTLAAGTLAALGVPLIV
jgi:Putative peptidoglycan binding domain